MLAKEYWDTKHKDSEGRYNRVTDFSRLCYHNFMQQRGAKVLDLCCGKGADSIFFHNKGLKVYSLDYSGEAIKQFNMLQKKYEIFIASMVWNILEKLPYDDNSFEYIYSRLGLYYFTDAELEKIIPELKRVLKSEGLLMLQVKSTSDKDFDKGKELEKDMFEDETGYIRHFFSREYAKEKLREFNIVMIEERKIDNGSAYLEIIVRK